MSELAPGHDWTSASPLGSANGWLYFTGYTDALGAELWRTDGSLANTQLVVDGVPGSEGLLHWSFVARGVALGNRFVFYAEDAEAGLEPWSTDGSAAGTTRLKDIYSGPDWSNPLVPTSSRRWWTGTGLFLRARPDAGFEPWITDGIARGNQVAGHRLPGVIGPSMLFFHLHSLGSAGGAMFGGFADREHGKEPWTSRGTAGTTALLADLDPSTFDGQGRLRALVVRIGG